MLTKTKAYYRLSLKCTYANLQTENKKNTDDSPLAYLVEFDEEQLMNNKTSIFFLRKKKSIHLSQKKREKMLNL